MRTGFFTLPLYFLRPASLQPVIAPLVVGLVVVTAADLVRLRNKAFEARYEALLGPFMREVEKVSAARLFCQKSID